MNNRFKCVFDKIHAEEDLKEKTKAYLRSRMLKGRASVSGRIPLRPLVAVASVLIFIFVTAGFRFYFTPSVVISIDINPSIELGINGLNRVISVTGYNNDGKKLAASLPLRHKKYGDALDLIMSSEQIGEYFRRDEVMAVTVISNEGNRGNEVLNGVKKCTSSRRNIYCYSGSFAGTECAHEAGLSRGKYQAFLRLRSMGSVVSEDEIKGMTMKEIRDMILSLSDSDDGTAGGSGDADMPAEPYAGYGRKNRGNGGKHGGRWGRGEHGGLRLDGFQDACVRENTLE